MKNTILYSLLILIFISACKKDEPLEPVVDPCLSESDQDLKVSVEMKFNDQPFSYGTVYTLDNGYKVRFSAAQFYLSAISLENSTGNTSHNNNVILIQPDFTIDSLGKIQKGNYDTLNLIFGLDSLTNHGDPSVYPSGHPLNFIAPSMHWSWSQGYLFARIEGQFDSHEITDLHPGSNFYYHVGAPSNNRSILVAIPYSIAIKACNSNNVKLKIDMENLFTDVDLETENNIQHGGANPLSEKLRQNLVSTIKSNQ